ncbi:MAG: hypothetical protein IPH28_08580 [Cytophagaceae bacterium]|nr:hypothetical protein [Cytophagaceae bacterium]
MVKNATIYYEIDVRLLEEMFWFKDGADTKFTVCKSESTQIREFENNILKEDKKFNHYKDLPLAELYTQIAEHNAFQIAVIPNWKYCIKSRWYSFKCTANYLKNNEIVNAANSIKYHSVYTSSK